jgi:hypothetical protein
MELFRLAVESITKVSRTLGECTGSSACAGRLGALRSWGGSGCRHPLSGISPSYHLCASAGLHRRGCAAPKTRLPPPRCYRCCRAGRGVVARAEQVLPAQGHYAQERHAAHGLWPWPGRTSALAQNMVYGPGKRPRPARVGGRRGGSAGGGRGGRAGSLRCPS